MKHIIGVDVGGTKIAAGLVTAKGKLLCRIKLNTEAKKGEKAVIKNIVRAIKQLPDADAVGIGVPGTIDKGIVRYSPNLPFKNTNIKKIIQTKLKKKVFVDNDANCFALGETLFGAARQKKNVIGLTLGTGFGSGVIIDSKIYHGRSRAAELGHTTINFDGPKARCNNNGCIESYVSIRGILSRAKGLYIKNPKELFELAEKKNKKALKLWKETGFYLGIAISNFANIFDPDAIVIGGNIAEAWSFFSKEMTKTYKKKAIIKDVKVVKSKLGENAAILGAASLCLS